MFLNVPKGTLCSFSLESDRDKESYTLGNCMVQNAKV